MILFERLIGITSDSYTWKTSYDALGRRLQTIYTPKEGKPYCTQSFYDPEEEFQEIGTKQGDKVIWKIYGPKSCDAVLDHKGESASLVYDALDNLVAVATSNQVVWLKDFPGSYGPLSVTTSEEESLISFAQSLVWQSKAVDPTGLIWFGARYYDPRSGRFLSPDPIGYPICLDLYAYANGDPINNRDPDGRFASAAYQTVKPLVIDTLFNPRVQGALRATGGFVEMKIGMGTLGVCPPLGGFLIAHGIDNFQTGMNQAITGHYHDPLTVQLFEKTGMSHNAAHLTNDFMGIIGTLSGSAVQIAKAASTGYLFPEGFKAANEIEFNRFNKAAANISEIGQQNIRILRNWAKSKGWERLPNSNGGPEKWGSYVNDVFEWNLRIKPEPSIRPGLQSGSAIPRFDARIKNGSMFEYLNPFTGIRGGDKSFGTHIPLE